jgi:hypothetical protein
MRGQTTPRVRIAAEKKALDGPTEGVETAGYNKNESQESVDAAILSLKRLKKNGGDDGTRTRGLCRDRAAF